MVGEVGGGLRRVRTGEGSSGVDSVELEVVRGERWGGNDAAAAWVLRRAIAARGRGRPRGEGEKRGEGGYL